MESFKRNIYRTSFVKKSEEPVPEPKLWYISRGLTLDPDFCIPIDEIVYSQEQSITLGMVLYSDISLTQLAIGIAGSYLISSTFVEEAQSGSRTVIEVDDNSTVLNIEQTTCEPIVGDAISITEFIKGDPCSLDTVFEVFVEDRNDINPGTIIYQNQSLTLPYDTSNNLGDFAGINPVDSIIGFVPAISIQFSATDIGKISEISSCNS